MPYISFIFTFKLCMILQILFIVLREGHYRLLFSRNETMHQIHVDRSRNYRNHRNKTLERQNRNRIIRESWNHLDPINLNGDELPKAKIVTISDGTSKPVDNIELQTKIILSRPIDESDMDKNFLNCFSFHENYTRFYEEGSFRIKVSCQRNATKHIADECTFNSTSNTLTVMSQDVGKVEKIESLSKIKVNLLCEITIREKYKYDFVFSQPVIIGYTAISISMATANVITSVLIVITAMSLFSAAVLYHRKIVRKRKSTHIKWVENPLHESVSLDETDGTSLLPNWLRERNEIIFDNSCIEIGQILGIGNFGTASEGKIKLGNAVYFSIVVTLLQAALVL